MTSGIYKITNLINTKCYIGKSENIENRFKEHSIPYRWKQHSGKALYRAFLKYGIDNFKFEILEECDACDQDEREMFWIKHYNAYTRNENSNGYNMTEGGEGQTSKSQHEWWEANEEIKINMSKKMSGKNNPFYGKKHSQESRDKIGKVHRGKPMCEEQKELLSANNMFSIKIDVFDDKWNYIKTLNSMNSVNKYLNMKNCQRTLKNKIDKRCLYHGYYFVYHDDTQNIKCNDCFTNKVICHNML